MFADVATLNAQHGAPLRTDAEIAQYMRLVGGSPYLVQRGLGEMSQHGLDVQALESRECLDRIYGDHLLRILALLDGAPGLRSIVQEVLRGQAPSDAEGFDRLRAAGVMVGDALNDARPRCQLYAGYLERHLL